MKSIRVTHWQSFNRTHICILFSHFNVTHIEHTATQSVTHSGTRIPKILFYFRETVIATIACLLLILLRCRQNVLISKLCVRWYYHHKYHQHHHHPFLYIYNTMLIKSNLFICFVCFFLFSLISLQFKYLLGQSSSSSFFIIYRKEGTGNEWRSYVKRPTPAKVLRFLFIWTVLDCMRSSIFTIDYFVFSLSLFLCVFVSSISYNFDKYKSNLLAYHLHEDIHAAWQKD